MGRIDQDRIARIRLIRTSGIGPVTYRHLMARFGTAQAAIEAVPELARRGGGKGPQIAPAAIAIREIERVDTMGARHLFAGQGLFPPLLDRIDGAPAVLVVQGDLRLLERTAVAMVGARNASAAAIRLARQFAHEVGQAGPVIVSGLARGIDTAAHHGALESGTIAVVAGGIDIHYPPENEPLQRTIGERGLLVAEQPPGTEPKARHFPHRNRIIAGLAVGTVVMEAAPRSGSLITARFAADFGREVMAVPGSPLDPRAQGCNLLIRDGATLVQNSADILEAIRPIGGAPVRQPATPFRDGPVAADATERDRLAVVQLLGPVAVTVDEIVRQSGLAVAIVQTILLELELAGRLERHAGGRVSLVAHQRAP